MNLAVKPKQMKLLLGAAGILGYMLRVALYAGGVDDKGLLITGHWAQTGIWFLTAAVASALLLWCRQLDEPKGCNYSAPPIPSAIGAILAAAAFAFSPTAQFPNQIFAVFEPALRFAAAGSLAFISYCRFRRRTPSFLLHCVVCLYLALRLICKYQTWSVDPQIQNYVFCLGAHVALTIAAYQLAALDAGFGSYRNLWAAGLSGIYLSVISLSGNTDLFFLIGCIVWVFSNLNIPSVRQEPDVTID